LHASSNIICLTKSGRKRRVWHVAFMGDRTGTYRIFVAKSEGKTPLGRPTRRRENKIKMDL